MELSIEFLSSSQHRINSPRSASAHRNFRADLQENRKPASAFRRRALVGVIASLPALERAPRLRRPPDYFELRLDALALHLGKLEKALERLRAPLILTARHPAEGGLHQLTAPQRRKLLQRFLDRAAFIDLELRSGKIRKELAASHPRLILSLHDLADTPAPALLRRQLERAIASGASIFKLATRTDHAAQLHRLLQFFEEEHERFPIAAMGFGRLGGEARRQLLRRGSVLNYGALASANISGQLSLRKLRRISAAYIK